MGIDNYVEKNKQYEPSPKKSSKKKKMVIEENLSDIDDSDDLTSRG